LTSFTFCEVLSTAQGPGTNLASFTTAASLLPAQALYTIGTDDWFIGKALWIRASGQVSNVVTAQPTFTFNVNFGATVVFTTGALLTSTTAHTTVPWILDIQLTCRSVGGGTVATMMGQGWVLSRAFLDAGATADITTLGHPTLAAPETTPAVGTGFSSNASNQVDLQAACSVSNAANAIQLQQYWLAMMN
jgi:hypothetical protein